MKKLVKVIAFGLIGLVVVVYGGYQLLRYLFPDIKTETVRMYTAYETVETTCFAVRNETILQKDTSGYVYYTLEDGSRVAKDGKIASVYPTQEDALTHQQALETAAEIETLKSIQSQADAYRSNLDSIRTQIRQTMNRLVALTEANNTTGIAEVKTTLTDLLNKQQIITRKNDNFSARIAELEAEYAALKSRYKNPTGTIQSPCAGYFVSCADGYESSMTPKRLADITVSEIETLTSADPGAIPKNCVGKIVGDYEWYLVCTVPDQYLSMLKEGGRCTVQMPFVSEDTIETTVVSCKRETSGKMAVVLKCTSMSWELSTARIELLQIRLVKHTGLRVPAGAITTDAEYTPGVYILSGYSAKFCKIKQEFAEAGGYVICTPVEEDGYLRLYDNVIVKGKNLYDGKLLR